MKKIGFAVILALVFMNVVAQSSSSRMIEAKAPPQDAVFGSDFMDLSSGYRHTCGVKTDGTVRCWGYNESRELGIRSATYVSVALPIRGITSAVSVAAGEKHSCVLLRSTEVRCWGANGSGQLGDNTFETSERPVTVVKGDGKPLTGVVQISAGNGFTCARLNSGRATCWGHSFGLGDGTDEDRGYAGPEVSLPSVVDVAVAPFSTRIACAVTSAAEVFCWGENFSNMTKIGTPVKQDGISGAVSVLAADRHACALLDSASIRCWGMNFKGELGPTEISSGVYGAPGLTVQSLSRGGGYRTCVVTIDGKARCWGSGWNGGLGTGSTTDRSSPGAVKIDRSTELDNVRLITLGESQSCALTTGGDVYCWGYAGYTARPWAESGTDETSYAGKIAENPRLRLSEVVLGFGSVDSTSVMTPSASFKTNLVYCDQADLAISAQIGTTADLADARAVTGSSGPSSCTAGAIVLTGATKPGQLYYYRLSVSSPYGEVQDEIRSFTAKGKKPVLTVLPVTTVSESSAEVTVGYDGDGLAATMSAASCELSKTSNFTSSDARGVTVDGTTCKFSNLDPETSYFFRTTVSNAVGSTTTEVVSFSTKKRSGVSINNGDLFTNSSSVKLSVVLPRVKEGSSVVVSNDGGFAKSQSINQGEEFVIDWTLPSTGDERLPKTVYVRYTNVAGEPQTLTDDIILDTRPPIVRSIAALASRQPSDGVVVQSARISGSTNGVRLTVTARDENSGIKAIQVKTSARGKPTVIRVSDPKAKTTTLRLRTAKRTFLVSVVDRAGNASTWKSTTVRR